MVDGEIRLAFVILAKYITAKAKAVATQSQSIMDIANRTVGPCVQEHDCTMAYRLKGFTRMNPPKFIGSKVDEDPHDFLNEIYKIL